MMFDCGLVDRDTDRREFVPDLTNPLVVAEASPGAQSLMMWPCAHKGQVSTLGVVEENAKAAGRFLQHPQSSLGKALGARHLGR
jgi:hypothetical protein